MDRFGERVSARGSLFDAARQRAEALRRMRHAADKPGELPSDLPYVMADEFLSLWDAYQTAYEDGYQAGLDDERL